ncbi:MAG: response regulator transcription factor [Bacteroidota bacterium]
MKIVKLAIVDSHQMFREGMIVLIGKCTKLKVVISASNGKELIEKIAEERPDVVLMDLDMPVMDGFETTDYLKKNYPDIKILILTTHNDEEAIHYLIRAGIHGYILKNNNFQVITDAIYQVVKNGYYFNNKISKYLVQELTAAKKIIRSFKKNYLTPREIEVIRMICRGYTNKEIAVSLNVSFRTIDGHREKILSKTKAKNTANIVMFAIKNNLIAVIKEKKLSFPFINSC